MLNQTLHTKLNKLKENPHLYKQNDEETYRGTVVRMIVTAPITVSTKPGSHVVNTVSYPGTFRVRFVAPQRQLPHRFCITPKKYEYKP